MLSSLPLCYLGPHDYSSVIWIVISIMKQRSPPIWKDFLLETVFCSEEKEKLSFVSNQRKYQVPKT